MVSSHTSLPGLTIATHQIKLLLSLATTLPQSKLYLSEETEKYAPQPSKIYKSEKLIAMIANLTKTTS